MPEHAESGNPAPRNWFHRNLANHLVLGCVLLIALIQWPAIKGIAYRVTGIPQDRIAWRDDYQAALSEARATGKPLLVDFTASWCPPCQTMKYEVWPDNNVEALANGSFIPVNIDVDREDMTAARFNVSTIPTIIAVAPDGKVISRSGFVTASQLLGFMNRALVLLPGGTSPAIAE